jgi:hypothetical protein
LQAAIVRARRADGFGWMCMNAVLVEAIATTNVRKVLVVVLLSLLTLFLLLLVVDFTGLLDGSWREVYLKSRYFFRYGSTQRFYNQRFYKKTMTSPTNK